jgi:hypothetical protein
MREWQLSSQPEAGELLTPTLVIREPTPQEEVDRLHYTLLNIPQYQKLGFEQGQHYLLPLVSPTFQALTQPNTDLTILDNEEVRRVFEEQEYQRTFYTPGIQQLEIEERPHILEALSRFQVLHQQWGFTLFPNMNLS